MIARTSASTVAVLAVPCVLSPAILSRAHAEVWPAACQELWAGPLASLQARPLALWSNPAATAGAGWGAGVARLDPFGVEGFGRTDLAVTGRVRGLVVGAGWTRFGQEALAARAGALSLATSPIGARLRTGLAIRRHDRDRRSGWAADFGVLAVPESRLAFAAVARSALRAGRLEVSPDPELEVDLSWSQDRAVAAVGLVRDANGPVSASLATRISLGVASLYTSLEKIARGETRASLGLETRLPGGVALAAGREVGPVLPESRAGGIFWARGEPKSNAVGMRGRGEISPPDGPVSTATFVAEDSPAGRTARVELDALLESDSLENDLASNEMEGTDASGEERSPGEDDSDPTEPRLPIEDSKAADSRSPEDGDPAPFRLQWTATFGGRSSLPRGAGGAAAIALDSPLPGDGRVSVGIAASRDPGEPKGLDEHRLSLGFHGPRGWRAFGGALDFGLGEGLVAGERGRFENAVALASRPRRAPVPAAWGGAVGAPLLSGLEALVIGWRAERDARPLSNGLWPTSGRFHRSERERSRRSALVERAWGTALGWRPPDGRVSLGAMGWHAEYTGAAPRLLPGGALLRRGEWVSIFGGGASRLSRWSAEWAMGPGGRSAHAVRLLAAAPRSGDLAADLRWIRRSDGFSAAVATPARQLSSEITVDLRSRAGSRRPGAWLVLDAEESALPPTAATSWRKSWSREARAGLRAQRREMAGSIEVARSEGWRERAASEAWGAGWTVVPRRDSWRVRIRSTWSPSLSRARLALAYGERRARGARAETWELGWKHDLGGSGESLVQIEMRPAPQGELFASSPALVSDPLGGGRLVSSAAPARVTARIRFPMGRRDAGNAPTGSVLGRWTTSSGRPRFEIWLSASRGPGIPD